MSDTDKTTSALEFVSLEGEPYMRISHSDAMRPFFMSIVSPSNHWLFISSNGGLTAGRQNSDHALFPYYTDDKITESKEITGPKTILSTTIDGKHHTWEPFSERCQSGHHTSRHLYKHVLGHKVRFEEVNHDLGLTFAYEWQSSDRYGFVRVAHLTNHGGSPLSVTVLDGLQNILPSGVGSDLQRASSNLVDAYKRSELVEEVGLGIYALSAVIVDKAEPSEALEATIAYQVGLKAQAHLLSSAQVDDFRMGDALSSEKDVKGEKGAYFVSSELDMAAGYTRSWAVIAEVRQDHNKVIDIIEQLRRPADLWADIQADVQRGQHELRSLCTEADALQRTADPLRDARHFANVLFNIMRGGIFDSGYTVELPDFIAYLRQANHAVAASVLSALEQQPAKSTYHELCAWAYQTETPELIRLATEYLPLKFSRRHGDPSRPWNKFSINTKDPVDGSKILDYEGNWRDIFQNWEALAYAYPHFIEGMIFKFLNASTFDGYNPYRLTKGGFDWETIEPDDPWSYIGYWGDHQIIYLLKFLEFIQDHQPGRLDELFDAELFVYADVPYRIKRYPDIIANAKDTIDFDHERDEQIRRRRDEMGADGALLMDESGEVYKVTFIEKILASLLAKMSNLIPEAGIWMNTQRPEWNDANNALVGNGVSMVTLCYMRRYVAFFHELFKGSAHEGVKVSNELFDFYKRIRTVLEDHAGLLDGQISDTDRKAVVDKLGVAASDYRWHIYQHGFWGRKRTVSMDGLRRFSASVLAWIDHAIRANRRQDGLYHAYNLMSFEGEGIKVDRLDEMLEGQVAVLSAGLLQPNEVVDLLRGLKSSKLFRDDQYSYLLYPNKDLPGFLEKNRIPEEAVEASPLLTNMVKDGDRQLINRDRAGHYHFNSQFKNADELEGALDELAGQSEYVVTGMERSHILSIYESVFHHKAFTGRSGTFFGYEGLGSIYWHMVSKLLLAVQENAVAAIRAKAAPSVFGEILDHYYEIYAGIGVNKSPQLYGAFPTDPYSHTPAGRGAQQPGMTGQVKEDILSRIGELGVFVREGRLTFDPCLLQEALFLDAPHNFDYLDLHGERQSIHLQPGELFFTYAQTPICYMIADEMKLDVVRTDGTIESTEGWTLSAPLSASVFARRGEIMHISVSIPRAYLKK